MTIPLRVVILEDHAGDAELMVHELRRAGFAPNWQRVETEADYLAALAPTPDLILADYSLPQFDAPAALALLQEAGLDIPFIVVSGTVGEDTAVTMMKAGAHDYLMKDKLLRLAPAVEREIREAQTRRERQRVEEALRESEDKFKYIFDNSILGKSITLPAGEINANKAFGDMLGYTQAEFQIQKWQNITHPDDIELTQKAVDRLLSGEQDSTRFTKRYIHKNGAIVWADVSTSLRRDEAGQPLYFMTAVSDITARKQAEESLRESEEKFRLLTEKSVFGIYIIQDAKMAYVNPSIAKMFGYSPEEIIGTLSPKDLIHPDDIQAVMRRLQERLAGEIEKSNIVYKAIKKDGSLIYIEVYGIIVDYQGRPAVMGTLIDVTARQQAEESLRASEARFSTIFHASPAAIALTRLGDSQFIDVNEAWQAMTGYTHVEAMGHTPFELNLWANPQQRQQLTETLREQGTARDEVQIRRKSGEISDVLMSAELIELAGERYLLTMAQDITVRKQADEALHQNEERLRLITENMSDTVWLMDMNLQTTFISPSVERLRGYTLAELQTLPLDKQLTPPSLAQAMTVMAQELTPTRLADKNTPIVVMLELEFYRHDGSTFWSENSFTIIRNLDGQPVAILGVGRDITDRKQARDKIRQQLDELQRWHDLTLDRETRALELKSEVNELLAQAGQPPRYPSAEV